MFKSRESVCHMAERGKGIPGKEATLKNLKSRKELGLVGKRTPVCRRQPWECWKMGLVLK